MLITVLSPVPDTSQSIDNCLLNECGKTIQPSKCLGTHLLMNSLAVRSSFLD